MSLDKRNYNYYLKEDGAFVIENFNRAMRMPSFLPGIAGKYGIPIWVFYVNKGQCISSFGIDGKDHSILEFHPANKAFQLTPLVGFRTFIKVNGKKSYEPFSYVEEGFEDKIKQEMIITSYDLSIREINKNLGIEMYVNYFTLPNEPIGALVRFVKIKNLNKKKINLEIIDGLPKFVSYGLLNFMLKDLSNLTEAWVDVENLSEKVPFYKLKVAVADKPEVEILKSGNFFASKLLSQKGGLLPVIVDPELVFGDMESLVFPEAFDKSSNFSVPKNQRTKNIFPSAFSYLKIDLDSKEEMTFVSVSGNARNYSYLEDFLKKFKRSNYIEKKMQENKQVIEEIQDSILTVSKNNNFDYHCRQCFLDNILRGGYPYSIKTKKGPVIFHIYSRRHGDLERDYNWFQLLPTYFSQGNGNYRDVNQNRRNDVFFNPDVGESTIKTFMNLIQLDGYNPLSIKGSYFWIEEPKEAENIAKKYAAKWQKLAKYLQSKFTPGGLLIFVEEEGIALKSSKEEFLSVVLEKSQRMEDSDHGEGFWSDHWTYNLDLIESYLSIFPDKLKSIMFDDKDYIFYDNYARVLPRKKKCLLTEKGVRQFGSVYVDAERKKQIAERLTNPFAVRTDYGKGPVYKTTLFVKFLTLAINKAATLDPFGVGIEMEADKPNWYDALNGLPGIFGSSISETFELKRLILMLRDIIKKEGLSSDYIVVFPEELASFFDKLRHILKEDLSDWDFWERSHTAKEEYREKIVNGISGVEIDFKMSDIIEFLDNLLTKLDSGLKRAFNKEFKLPNTYFVNEVVEYEKLGESDDNRVLVWPKKFNQRPLPLFLEGVVHYMRCEDDPAVVRSIHKNVMTSPLFDKKLKMFKVNASLEKESYDIGRTKIFPPGWLENESIWIHMEYKYMLELLKNGLYEEFFESAKNVLIYNLDPFKYGRSILENSSFIISSAYYDDNVHGKGCFARLSGSTAEFVHMWVIMTTGGKPFFVNENKELCFELKPVIPSEFFTDKTKKIKIYDSKMKLTDLEIPKNSFAFKFLGSIPVIYVNPHRLNTWEGKAFIKKIVVEKSDGKRGEFEGSLLKGDICLDIRNRRVRKITAYIEKG